MKNELNLWLSGLLFQLIDKFSAKHTEKGM